MERRLFQKEYERLFLPLGMFALRIVGDVEMARDIVQSAFEAAWPMADKIECLKSYMYTAVRNAAIGAAGAAQSRCALERWETGEMDEVTQEEIDTSERDARLWAAIDRLPDRCREVFLMSKRDGLSHREIALELGIAEKTVENQISKALSRLRSDGGLSQYTTIWFLVFL